MPVKIEQTVKIFLIFVFQIKRSMLWEENNELDQINIHFVLEAFEGVLPFPACVLRPPASSLSLLSTIDLSHERAGQNDRQNLNLHPF